MSYFSLIKIVNAYLIFNFGLSFLFFFKINFLLFDFVIYSKKLIMYLCFISEK